MSNHSNKSTLTVAPEKMRENALTALEAPEKMHENALTLNMISRNFSRKQFDILFFLFVERILFHISCTLSTFGSPFCLGK